METSKKRTIADLVANLPRLRVYDDEISAFEEHCYISTIPVVDKATYLGIEMEIENVDYFKGSSPYWKQIEDGSLRNHGCEFITPPLRAHRVENALNVLFNDINKNVDFSERTSVHVHMNIRTLTIEQLQALILCYLVFERTIYRYIGHDRDQNIFCVPLVETSIGSNLRHLFHEKSVDYIRWFKYTGLNLIPILEKGTIEFRHHYGTGDIKRILEWINIILSLKKFALRKDPEYIWDAVRNLNTSSQYRLFMEEVFGSDLTSVLWVDRSGSDIEECVTYIKQRCIVNPFVNELQTSYDQESLLGKKLGAGKEIAVRYYINSPQVVLNQEAVQQMVRDLQEDNWNTLEDELTGNPIPTQWFNTGRVTGNRVVVNTAVPPPVHPALRERTTNAIWDSFYSINRTGEQFSILDETIYPQQPDDIERIELRVVSLLTNQQYKRLYYGYPSFGSDGLNWSWYLVEETILPAEA